MREGPERSCGATCREWIAASGPITADTVRDFQNFAEARDIRGAMIVLDSGGGAVNASLELGRRFRDLGLKTTVGRSVRLTGANSERARLSPDGECASMCVFMMLGGIHRTVPAEAKISVHQIWPGNKRGDASAESYTAEELVRIQRDVGRIASYTVEMGGDIELFELAMRIPPWERLRSLSQVELRRLRLQMLDTVAETPTSGATAPEKPSRNSAALPRLVERGWVFDKAQRALTRRHAITVEGDQIGQFELALSCGRRGVRIAYSDSRVIASDAPSRLQDITLWFGSERVSLKVQKSGAPEAASELKTFASGTVAMAAIERLRDTAGAALTVGTRSSTDSRTTVRVGVIGLASAYQQLLADCSR